MNTKKLEEIKEKYAILTQKISDPKIISDNKAWTKLVKEHSSLEPIVEGFSLLEKVKKDIVDAKHILDAEKDKELLEFAEIELQAAKQKQEKIEEGLKLLLLPKDPLDEKGVIVEIRAGTGGEEAALFANALYRMYRMYADKNRLLLEEVDIHETELGGVKEAVFSVSGDSVFAKLKFESGVHRVQRVPDTETQGRIHTSAATVAVLPQAEEMDVEILEKDLKIDTYRSSGAGGQHVNKTESAIRITHIPTGIVVQCQDGRSQIKNRDKAMAVLKTKIYDKKIQEINEKESAKRKSQVGSGDRSERIRTYNYREGRVTDHRIGVTLYTLETFLNGDLDEMIERLRIHEQTERLKNG